MKIWPVQLWYTFYFKFVLKNTLSRNTHAHCPIYSYRIYACMSSSSKKREEGKRAIHLISPFLLVFLYFHLISILVQLTMYIIYTSILTYYTHYLTVFHIAFHYHVRIRVCICERIYFAWFHSEVVALQILATAQYEERRRDGGWSEVVL